MFFCSATPANKMCFREENDITASQQNRTTHVDNVKISRRTLFELNSIESIDQLKAHQCIKMSLFSVYIQVCNASSVIKQIFEVFTILTPGNLKSTPVHNGN